MCSVRPHRLPLACKPTGAELESQTPPRQAVAVKSPGFLSMLNSTWRICCFLGFLAIASALGCSGQAGPKRIMFITNGDDPFWDALLSGLNEGAKQHQLAEAKLSVHRDVNDGTAEGQIEKLRQYATQDDIAGVAVSVIQADNLAIIEEMRNLQKKGVKIITVDGDVNRAEFRDARSFYKIGRAHV